MAHNAFDTASISTAQMPNAQPDISAMVAARICHDLVSPLGAIGNGIELLQVAGQTNGPELELVAESTSSANAKLRFFRVAFGYVWSDQMISQAEIRSILSGLAPFQKHNVIWQCSIDLTRKKAKLAFLLLMCLETTLGWGGEIEIAIWDGGARMIARSDRLKLDDSLWQSLESGQEISEITSARVQFALAVSELRAQDSQIKLTEWACTLALDVTFGTTDT